MSQTVPAKIVLKSTTKMSLNDRFTTIQKMRPPPMNPQEVRAQLASNQQSTQQNRRLAQQMANRPSVQAALNRPQKSLKQRLGPSNVKSRLNLNAIRGGPGGGPIVSNRGQRGGGRVFRRPTGRGRGGRGGGGGAVMQNNMSDMNGNQRGRGVRGFRGRGGYRGNRGGTPRWMDDDWRPFRGQRGGRRGYGRVGPDYRYDGQRGGKQFGGDGTRGGRGRGRGGRFQRGRGGGGRGRGGRGGATGVSRDELDNQIEEYMSKTKSTLNSELDAYMQDAD